MTAGCLEQCFCCLIINLIPTIIYQAISNRSKWQQLPPQFRLWPQNPLNLRTVSPAGTLTPLEPQPPHANTALRLLQNLHPSAILLLTEGLSFQFLLLCYYVFEFYLIPTPALLLPTTHFCPMPQKNQAVEVEEEGGEARVRGGGILLPEYQYLADYQEHK